MTSPQMYVGRKAAGWTVRHAVRGTHRAVRRTPSRLNAAALVGGGAVLGALVAWLADPRRRRMHAEHAARSASSARSAAAGAAATASHAANVAQGAVAQATGPVRNTTAVGDGAAPDDATLARKVESIAFREAGVPTGRVSVNAERGVVFLRGELDSADAIGRLVRACEEIDGVRAVQSLLHVAGTPAPSADGGSSGGPRGL